MTEKRFSVDNHCNLYDNEYNVFYPIEDSRENIELLCRRLNNLKEENERLKQENNKLISLVKKMGELGGFNKHLLKTINESFEERLRNNPMPTKSDNDE